MSQCGETIAAIATASGPAGVAVVRVSGSEARAVALALTGRDWAPGRIRRERLHSSAGALLDEAVVLSFAAPHSYTGEDTVEFQCHGGAVTPRRVLEACFAAGARLARRGEFTERAFLNGKLDYDQAESVLALVNAKTARAADRALAGLGGHRRRALGGLYDEAISLSVEIEHALDVDESELGVGFWSGLAARAVALGAAIGRERRSLGEGRILREGALVVLAGRPNAGKSSLMNALLQSDRVLVSETAGTTRDSIEEWLDLDGWPVRLVDTAGLRETPDAVEAAGVMRSEALVGEADVVVRLAAADDEPAVWPDAGGRRELRVLSKADLATAEELARAVGEGVTPLSVRNPVMLSAFRQALVRELEEFSETGASAGEGDADETTAAALVAAERALRRFSTGDPVLAGNAVRTACELLGECAGATYSEDLLDRLFSRFCVGK